MAGGQCLSLEWYEWEAVDHWGTCVKVGSSFSSWASTSDMIVSVSAPGSHPAPTLGQRPTMPSAPIAHREKLRLRDKRNLSLI